MVNFLVLIAKIIDFTKNDIDKGNTPSEMYKICSSIRTSFCLSYDIRKNNTLFLYFQEDKVLVKFEGNQLRYLGPDERSQALLLNKALNKIDQYKNLSNMDWIKSTPGIYVKTFQNDHSFILWLKSLNLKHVACISNSNFNFIFEFPFLAHTYDFPKITSFSNLENLVENFFIISINSHDNSLLIKFLTSLVKVFPSMLEHITLTPLNKITAIEDKILHINFQIDYQESINKLKS